jgi:hypothetical protein
MKTKEVEFIGKVDVYVSYGVFISYIVVMDEDLFYLVDKHYNKQVDKFSFTTLNSLINYYKMHTFQGKVNKWVFLEEPICYE